MSRRKPSRRPEIAAFGVPLIFGVLGALLVCWFTNDTFPRWYVENLRRDLFMSFMTLSGFVFSITAFIVIKMKEEVFGSLDYARELDATRRDLGQSKPTEDIFDPLRRLSRVLLTTVGVCLSTALVNATLGFCEARWAASVCIAFAGTALGFLGVSLYLSQINLTAWFRRAEDSLRQVLQAEAEAREAATDEAE